MTAECSVVIPSRNRARKLDALLQALAAQSCGPDRFDVIVVLDGTTDRSDAVLSRWSGVLPSLRWIDLPRGGPARARNAGVAASSAPVILFLDDDVVPAPDLVERHLDHHRAGTPLAIAGVCPIEWRSRSPIHWRQTWAWWVDFNEARRRPDHTPSFRDFCTGNVSLRRADLEAVGRFDETFVGYGSEDWELGHRLAGVGVAIEFDDEIVAVHDRDESLLRAVLRNRETAHGHVHLCRKHPELAGTVRLGGHLPPVAAEAYRAPVKARAKLLVALARLFVVPRSLRRWNDAFGRAVSRAYWIGVAEATASWQELVRLRESASGHNVDLDLDSSGAAMRSALPRSPLPVHLRIHHRGVVVSELTVAGDHLDARSPGRVARLVARSLPEDALLSASELDSFLNS